MNTEKRYAVFQEFTIPQFNYCPVVWIFHDTELSKRINNLHQNVFKETYQNVFKETYQNVFKETYQVFKETYQVFQETYQNVFKETYQDSTQSSSE